MTQKHHYIPGLDGLRAFAVLSVMAYHFSFSWARGGFLGVDIFFVLSGYLITSIALAAQGNQMNLNLREFWVKRFRRLLPAAYVMVITTVVWVMLFNQDLLHTVRGDAISSLFYTSNWWFIFHKLSYFDSFGSPSPLKNLWSLAIEEQFYILWPIVLIAGSYLFKKRSSFSILVLIGIIFSAILMGLLYQPGTDASRVYYGTDTRSFELLIGCFLAFIWPMKRLSSRNLTTKLGNILNLTSFITFGILILSVVFLDEFQSFLYRGGMVLVCVNAAILIACISHPVSLLGKLLSFKPLRWVGSRSYGIYLWHYPVMVLGTPVYEIGNPVIWRVGLQVVIIFIIAEISYRFIEMPIRKHGFRPFLQQYLAINVLKWSKLPLVRKVPTILLPLVLLVFTTGITSMVKGNEQKDSIDPYPTQVKINHVEQPSSSIGSVSISFEKQEIMGMKGNSSDDDNGKGFVPKEEQNEEISKGEKSETSVTTVNKTYSKILAIGDSVMLDIAASLHKKYPDMTIDGKVGRQVSQAVQLAHSYENFNQPENAVIIELGTNGYFTNNQIDSLLQSFSKAHIYLVNTRVPRPWESQVNNALAAKAKENKNITLVDWHSAAINHPEYFAPDGVHLVPKGIEALTTCIDQALK
ncbi:acetyltransferase [Cytobacillus depressus]|uniref:Acetyltransferase n=1 Tax=Cytobacillus depressus TaxID=1602942 RepID=A0A6L3UZS9_9BACI|nr:acyltransferase family protein [Cytobacillus depressus]KAB2329952.1 acetyltransferase [Cytobacillus depressus]